MANAAHEPSSQGRRIEVTAAEDNLRRNQLTKAFQMPSVQTMVSRKSSITNAFVNSLVPVFPPTVDEIEHALAVLRMDPSDVRCAYCGNKSTEWDHLRPLVLKHRPTGFVSEIANLVPSCAKCNQSKGNKPWREWMLGGKGLSPSARGIPDLADRVACLDAYERWRSPTVVNFEAILGNDAWCRYWQLWENVNAELRKCQEVADAIRTEVINALKPR
jgi:5-methylcytosine-specific restriction endonuclease McrA